MNSAYSISGRMRSEWDRRIQHDYRFWMGDGVSSDEEMWSTGERDLSLLLVGLPSERIASASALDIGCGVGRLLHSASSRFKSVIGLDVSEAALSSAKKLLADKQNISLALGDGTSFTSIDDQSIDIVYSFASVASLPVSVFAAYLREIKRVLKTDGVARIQLFVGSENLPSKEDTLSVRCYQLLRLKNAARLAGLELADSWELVLPFEVSDREAEIIATIVDLRPTKQASVSEEQILAALISTPESEAGDDWRGSVTEYEMALSRAEQHLSKGENDKARVALEFAVANFKDVEPQILELLEQLNRESWGTPLESSPPAAPQFFLSERILEENSRALSHKKISEQILYSVALDNVAVGAASNGELILSYQGTALENPEKPRRAAELWAERALSNPRVKEGRDLIIFGSASAYHLEELASRTEQRLHLVEPRPEILRALFSVRSLPQLINRLSSISTSVAELKLRLKEFEGIPELLIHPQSQVISRESIDELKGLLYAKRGRLELRPSIGVVGPLYGGTLPITHSVTRALLAMKQRVRCFDMSSFHQNFVGIEGFVRDRQRRDLLQNHYVETLSQIVLESINEKPVEILICLAQAPLSPKVLTELRSRGIITVMWFVEDGRRFTSWKQLAPFFDYMFVIQKGEFPKLVESAGAGRAIYMPVACDPFVHQPLEVPANELERWGSEVSFVGAGYNNRQQMFASLAHRNFKIWGTEWPTLPPFDRLVQERGRRIAPDEYVKIFNSTKINLNLHSSSERDGIEPNGDFVNPRVFELAACKAFQLVDNRTLLPELFSTTKELATFDSLKDLENKIDFFLANPAKREEFATAARERVLEEHTYEKRLEQMLGHIYADRYEELKAKEQQSPWSRTLAAAKKYPEVEARLRAVFERGDDAKFQGLIADIQTQKGKLSETEMKLLFLWHVRQSITTINDARAGRG